MEKCNVMVGYNWSQLSKWREMLMGIGITGVMIAHLLQWSDIHGVLSYIIKPFVGLVFTEGFLLLSGLGLYYSYKKNGDIWLFYKKRVKRLFIPFLIISFPFYLERAIAYDQSIVDFFLNISSLHFWFKGNDGMWYISVSLLLYFLFPFLYKFMFNSSENVAVRGVTVLFMYILLCVGIYLFFPSYYELIDIGLIQMPMFGIGVLIGCLSYNSLNLKYEYIYIILLGVIAIMTNLQDGFVGKLGNGALRLFSMIMLCPLFFWSNQIMPRCFSLIRIIFEWFGKYTLELYVLHMFVYFLVSRWLQPMWSGALSIVASVCIAPLIHDFINISNKVVSK